MKARVLWLVTARSGSKSIPDKNIKRLNGFPLLAYRIRSVLGFAKPEDVWISTDSARYAKIAASHGAQVPFLRPKSLSTDTAKSVDVVLHAMRHAESLGRRYDALGLLEPTSPFILPEHLKEAVERLFANRSAESIVAVRRVRPSTFYVQEESPFLAKVAANIAAKGALRRQDERHEITPSGGFYISKWDIFKKKKTFYSGKTLAFRVPELCGLEIDEPLDWAWAEFLMEKKIMQLPWMRGRS